MSFVISNKEFYKALNFGKIFYIADNLYISGEVLVALETSAFGNCRQKLIDKALHEAKSGFINTISNDEFYSALCYSANDEIISIQTDIVAYESVFYYCKNNCIVISDSVLKVIEVLKSFGIQTEMSEKSIRKFIYMSNYYSPETVFSYIRVIEPATNCLFDISNCSFINDTYDEFRFNPQITDPEIAAQGLYNELDALFKERYSNELTYGLGVSGGLDSRVAGYFALKNGYKVQPFFLGRECNCVGVVTNDAKRSKEVTAELGLKSIEYIPTERITYAKKLEYDSLFAPLGSPNVEQNSGYDWPEFDVLIHGMMGGELFGGIDFLTEENLCSEPRELVRTYISAMNCIPKYIAPYSLFGKAAVRLPITKNLYSLNDEEIEKMVPREARDEVEEELYAWVIREKAKGLSNINILMKLFYSSQSRNVCTGYYSTLENSIYALGAYMNPRIFAEFRKWDDRLFLNRVVQKALIKKCGNLSAVRDQTTGDDAKSIGFGKVKHAAFIAERVFRGSGMYYSNYSAKDFSEQLDKLKDTEIIKEFNCDFEKLSAAKSELCQSVMKMAWLQKQYGLVMR